MWLRCPKCAEGNLFITYEEHAEYPLTSVDAADDYCEVDGVNKDVTHSEVIHIRCSECKERWTSLTEMERLE